MYLAHGFSWRPASRSRSSRSNLSALQPPSPTSSIQASSKSGTWLVSPVQYSCVTPSQNQGSESLMSRVLKYTMSLFCSSNAPLGFSCRRVRNPSGEPLRHMSASSTRA